MKKLYLYKDMSFEKKNDKVLKKFSKKLKKVPPYSIVTGPTLVSFFVSSDKKLKDKNLKEVKCQ